MYLPSTKSTPEVDYRLTQGPVLKMTGPCYPLPADVFFDRVINGDPTNPKDFPGLHAVLKNYKGAERLKYIFDLQNINSRSEKGPLLDLLDLLHAHNVEIEWLRRDDDTSNVRMGSMLAEYWARKCGFTVK